MSEDLQSILEKINRDGIEKARAEAERILADARKEAEDLKKASAEACERKVAEATQQAEDLVTRGRETLRQAARDVVLSVEAALGRLFDHLLVENVDAALANEQTVLSLVTQAIADLSGDVQVKASTKLAAALKASLAAKKSITVVTDERAGSGFSVLVDNGRVEHAFTRDVIAAELAKRLRPDLAALLNENN